MNALIIGLAILFGIFFLRWTGGKPQSHKGHKGFGLLAFVFFVSFVVNAFSQTDNETTNALATTAANVATPFIVRFAVDHPTILTIIAVIGFLRFIMKPIVAAVHAYTASTETKEDDAILEKVERSAAFKWVLFLVDWLGSIKPPPKQRAPGIPPGSSALLLLTVAIASLTGCARFTTTQTDQSYENGLPSRKIVTKAAATTFAASKSALAQWKASQTDKTQGASVGSLDQESDASKLLDAVVQAAVKAGAATVKP